MDDALGILRIRVAADHAGLDRECVHDGLGFADEGELEVAPAGVGSVGAIRGHAADVLRRVDVLAEGEAEVFLRAGAVHERQGLDEFLPPAGLAPGG
jgi:hypothetical protein